MPKVRCLGDFRQVFPGRIFFVSLSARLISYLPQRTGAHVEMFPSRKTPFNLSMEKGKGKEKDEKEETEAEELEEDTSPKCIKACAEDREK